MAIEKGDFIEMQFTGRVSDDGEVFDTTDEVLAKEEDIYQPQQEYGSIKLVVGERQVVPGLDEALEGMELGEHEVHLDVEDAFGKKDTDKLKIIPEKEFDKQGIKPYVGLEVNIDGQIGTVRSVTGGRTVVDFNHPLAGKELDYEINIKRKIEDQEKQLKAILQIMNTPYEEINIEDDQAEIVMEQEMPEDLQEKATEEIERLVGYKATFTTPEQSSEEE